MKQLLILLSAVRSVFTLELKREMSQEILGIKIHPPSTEHKNISTLLARIVFLITSAVDNFPITKSRLLQVHLPGVEAASYLDSQGILGR